MDSPADVIGAVAEIFTWVGFGAGALLAGVALVLYVADGTWLPAHGMIDDAADGSRVIRWIDDEDAVNEARLTEHDLAHLAHKDDADIWFRRGSTDRFRLTRGSPAVRTVGWFALGLIGVGLLALIGSWVLLFIEG